MKILDRAKGYISWLRSLGESEKGAIAGVLILLVILLLMLVKSALAGEPKIPNPNSPLPAFITHMKGWELVYQDINASTGEPIGIPILIKKFDSVYKCNIAQANRKFTTINNTSRVWMCRHAGDQVI
jgi:hypothetical protein